jgi:iron complex transport system substrate-binding protein
MRGLSRRQACMQLGAAWMAGRAQGAWGASGLRIVAAGGALTETLYALGADAVLVGVDSTSSFPAAATKLPSVGYMRALSAEGVLALSPTHLVATEDAGPPAVIRQLEAAGVRVVVLGADHRFEGLLARVKRVGELVQRGPQAQALTDALRREWSQVGQRVRLERARRAQALGGRAPLGLFVMAHSLSQVMVAGRNSAADAMLTCIGVDNPMARQFAGYKPLTAEAAIAAAPDVIFATEQGLQTAGGVAGLLQLPGLADTPAGRAGRVVAMDALWMLGFGPRLPSAVQTMSQACSHAVMGRTSHAGGQA